MNFAALDGHGWGIIIGAIFFGITGILNLVYQQRTLAAARDAATKAEALAKVAAKTHTLVNSNMGIQLLRVKNAADRLAALPTATDQDREDAAQAATDYAEHQRKQAKVDAVEALNS